MSDKSDGGVIGTIRSRYTARLGLALLGAVVLLLILGVAVNAQTASQVRKGASENLETSAAIQSDEITEWAEGNQRQVRTVSQLPALQSSNHSRINQKLGDLVESGHVSDEVVAIHVVDKQEKAIIASSRPEKFVGKSPAEMDEPFVPKIKEGFAGPDEVYVSKPFHIPLVDFPIVAMLSKVPGESRVVVFMINPTGEINDLRQPVASGHTHVVTANGNAVAAPNNTTHSGPAKERAITNALNGDTGVVETEAGNLMGYAAVGSQDWVVLTHVDRSQAFAMITTVRNGIGAMVLVALLSLGMVGLTVGRNTASSLRSLAADARDLGEGDLEVTFDTDRPDEIGTLAQTLASTRDSLAEEIERTKALNQHLETKAEAYQRVMRDAAAGDLTRRMDPRSESEAMTAIAEEFNAMIAEIEETTADLQQFADEVATASEMVTASADEVYSASEQVTESIQEISDGATDQDEQLQAVANEMDDLSATTEEIATASNDVAELASETASAGQRGRDAAQAAIQGLDEIKTTSDEAVTEIEQLESEMAEIDDLIDVIAEIAMETNMLALNAGIEVKRSSSDEGNSEGFAAVAEKIKELAEEAQTAASDIEQRLEQIQTQTEQTSEEVQSASSEISKHTGSIEQAIESLEEIADYAQETNDGIQQIRDTTEQQAASTQEVVAMVDEVAAIAKQTATESETVTSAAEEQTAKLTEVSGMATHLSAQSDELLAELAEFHVNDSFQETDETALPAIDPSLGEDN